MALVHRGCLAVATLAATVAARAQSPATLPADSVADGSELSQVVRRLDTTSIGLIVVAVLILALLVWRVAAMVRRERPAARPARRPRRADGNPLDQPTIQRPTDWGFDQNKRASLARSPITMPSTDVDLPSLDAAVTQWSTSEVHAAANAGTQPDDALGRAPSRAPSPYRTSFNPYFKGDSPASRIEVVEVADTLLQAELLVQLGDPKQAMTLLSQHIRETEKPGPAVWLMLLNLYQATGREAQYNALSAGFRTLFNAEVPPWATTPDTMARDLESYPQVMTRIQNTWPTPEARSTIEAMLNDDRGGSRQGFSLTAYRDLLFLVEILAMADAIVVEEDERSGIRRKLGSAA